MKLLVTGGAGFIGSHFVRMLLAGDLGQPGERATQSVTVLDALAYSGAAPTWTRSPRIAG